VFYGGATLKALFVGKAMNVRLGQLVQQLGFAGVFPWQARSLAFADVSSYLLSKIVDRSASSCCVLQYTSLCSIQHTSREWLHGVASL
jgi:hypothetical protein